MNKTTDFVDAGFSRLRVLWVVLKNFSKISQIHLFNSPMDEHPAIVIVRLHKQENIG